VRPFSSLAMPLLATGLLGWLFNWLEAGG